MKRASSILITLTALCTTCIGADPSTPQKDEPPYRSSVVGTDFDFITESDPDTFSRLEDKGQGPAEMPDKSDRSAPLRQEAFLFVAHFNSAEWQDAQKQDGGYITDYARKNPRGEDLAESALFAYTLLHHPNRIQKEEAARIARIIPNRIAFVENLLPKDKPLHFAVEAKR